MKPLHLLALLSLLAACAAPESGIRDPKDFAARAERTEITSAKPPLALARCFQDTATLLPFTTLLTDADGKGATYRLRGYGYSFEEIRFRPGTGKGTQATVRLAPGVNQKWRDDFAADRLGPLRRCAG